MSQPSPDAKAVVRAAEALTTQVRRIADALEAPVVRTEVAATTTGDDGPLCVCGDPIEWWTGPGDAAGWVHSPNPGRPILDVHKPRPADEDVVRADRLDSLGVLLSRISNGLALTPDEAKLLLAHVDAEVRESTTARTVAAGNKRHVQVMYDELQQANEAARRALEQRDTADRVRAEAQRDRDQHAAVLREVLGHFVHKGHPGEPCLQTGWIREDTVTKWRSVVAPTAERPWWVDVAEIRAELEQAQAAIERVRNLRDPIAEALEHADYRAPMRRGDLADSIMPVIVAALDDAGQPTAEEPRRAEERIKSALDVIHEWQRDGEPNDYLTRVHRALSPPVSGTSAGPTTEA